MAKQEEKTEAPAREEKKEKNSEDKAKIEEIEVKEKKKFNPKIFLFGLPVFILQLIIVYFITANVLLSRMTTEKPETLKEEKPKEEKAVQVKGFDKPTGEPGKFIYLIEDIIVNPAGTDGKRLLLTSIGFDLNKEEDKTVLKSKEVIVKDIIISTISNKNLTQLDNTAFKDTLKLEISQKLKSYIPGLQIHNVYFSKYIIQ